MAAPRLVHARGAERDAAPVERVDGLTREPSARIVRSVAHGGKRLGAAAAPLQITPRFPADVFARRIVGWACTTTMDTGELPLQALEQAMSWAASHGGTDGLVHHSDHGARYIGLVCTTRVGEFGMLPSAGTVGDSYDNAMAESADGAYKTGLVWRRKPFRDLRDLELATFRWVSWWNSKRLRRSLGYGTPERTETEYYANQAAQAAPL